jgi:hypothetical protein
MSYLVQVLCGIAALVGLSVVWSKAESEQVRYAAIYAVLGLPLILICVIGVGRRILEKVAALEKKLDEASKAKGV